MIIYDKKNDGVLKHRNTIYLLYKVLFLGWFFAKKNYKDYCYHIITYNRFCYVGSDTEQSNLELTNKIEELEKSNNDLSKQLEDAQSQISNLKKENEILENEKSTLETEKQELNTQIEKLQTNSQISSSTITSKSTNSSFQNPNKSSSDFIIKEMENFNKYKKLQTETTNLLETENNNKLAINVNLNLRIVKNAKDAKLTFSIAKDAQNAVYFVDKIKDINTIIPILRKTQEKSLWII